MIIFTKKDLVIPRGLGNVSVAVTSGYTDSISREEVQEMIDDAISGHTAGVESINGETGAVNLKTINNQSIMGEGNIEITGSTPYVLPIASHNTLGGIKLGQNIEVEEDGTLNAIGNVTSASINTIWVGTLTAYNQMSYHSQSCLYFIMQE